ncbi:hypothetical protein ACVWZR_010224 [Bradyrhizobium sp. i1.3.1]
MISNAILMALVPVFFVLLLGYAAGRFHVVDNLHVDALNALVMDFAVPASPVRRDRLGVAQRDDRAGSAVSGARHNDVVALCRLVSCRAQVVQGVAARCVDSGTHGWLSKSCRRRSSNPDIRRGTGGRRSGRRRIGNRFGPHQPGDPDHGGNGRRQVPWRGNGGAADADGSGARDHQAGRARARVRHPVFGVGSEPRRARSCLPRADREFGRRRRAVP